MTASNIDYASPSTQFSSDVNSLFYQKDNRNYINVLSSKQLNTLQNISLLDIFLSTGNIIEPHIHQNASELVYCVSGSAVISIMNPFTNELLNFPIQPGQVANVPQAWWHYEIATVDNTHLLAIFDAPVPEVIFGSDILRLTPNNVLAYTYCLNEATVTEALAPITKAVIIGPPANCQPQQPQSRASAESGEAEGKSADYAGAYYANAYPHSYANAYAGAYQAAFQTAYQPYPTYQPAGNSVPHRQTIGNGGNIG
jgi:hypothetical protein